MAMAVNFCVVLPDELLNQLGRHEVGLQRVKDDGLENVTRDSAAVPACALTPRGAAGQIMPARGGQGLSASAANHQARQEMLGAPGAPELSGTGLPHGRRLADSLKARLHPLPQLLIDDPEMGNLLDNPVNLGVQTSEALARAGIFDIALLVPDETADVQLIPQDTGATGVVAADRRVSPRSAPWPGDTVSIEVAGDGAGGPGDRKFSEYAPYDLGLLIVDSACSVDGVALGILLLDDIVAIRIAAPRAALTHASFETAVRLLG